MRNRLRSLVKGELRHWHALAETTRKFLWSMAIYEFASPMLFTFVYAYIYRTTGDIQNAAWLNIGWYISTPIVFYINGLLLKRFHIKKIYSFGLVLMGLINFLIFILPITKVTVFFIGLIFGIPIGLYWANRNFLTLDTTTDSQRNFTKSFETIAYTIISIAMPPIIGTSLVKMQELGLWDFDTGYRVWMGISLIFLIAAGQVLKNTNIKNPSPRVNLLKTPSESWQRVRLARFLQGIPNGVGIFLPSFIILEILGNEQVLGITSAIMSILAIMIIYWFGTRVQQSGRMILLGFSYNFLLIMTCLFAVLFNQLGVILYLIGLTLADQFSWTALEGVIMKRIDDEEDGDPTNNFAYIVDQEIFLQVGRVTGTVLLLAVVFVLGSSVALRFMPILMALALIGLLKVLKLKL